MRQGQGRARHSYNERQVLSIYQEAFVAGNIYKKIEIVGTSQAGISEAVEAAVHRASRTLKGLDWFEVKEIRGTIADGRIGEYQATVSIGFRVLSDEELKG